MKGDGWVHGVAPAYGEYDELYQAHHRRVLRLCRVLLSDPDEADDVSQEVFLKLHREQGRTIGRDASAWGAWLTVVTVNACRDRRRSGWWKWWRERHHELVEAAAPSPGPTPEDQLLTQETRRRVWDALQALSSRQREIFVLRHVEGWPTDRVAETLGVSTGSVKRHLYRAVRHLRTALGAQR
jgi:RNA polymerase sigma-70 factor, ECF subfamily